MSLIVRTLLVMLLIGLHQQVVGDDELDFHRYDAFGDWSAQEVPLVEDLKDGVLNRFTTLEAALVVSGYDERQIEFYESKFAASAARCRSKLQLGATHQQRLRAIFEHLSNEFLQCEYRADLFDVGQTVSRQSYNCLTATILFKSMCRVFSIDVQAVWEPSHVRCWSAIGGSTGYVIETTASSPVKAIGPLASFPVDGSRSLTDVELVAKVFYNRGVSTLKSEKYASALVSTWAGCLLDPNDEPARSNLRACFNNWALTAATTQHDLALARRLLEEGVKLDPNYEPFTRNWQILFGL